jgi:FixJ family two-component response regulator
MTPLISIVEDDEPLREALRRVLISHDLLTVAFASAEEFLDSDLLPRVSCLIVDGVMPGMSGLTLHSRLMTSGHRIPTIVITGSPSTDGRDRALEAGVFSYLGKPFGEEVLLDSIRRALTRGHCAPTG